MRVFANLVLVGLCTAASEPGIIQLNASDASNSTIQTPSNTSEANLTNAPTSHSVYVDWDKLFHKNENDGPTTKSPSTTISSIDSKRNETLNGATVHHNSTLPVNGTFSNNTASDGKLNGNTTTLATLNATEHLIGGNTTTTPANLTESANNKTTSVVQKNVTSNNVTVIVSQPTKAETTAPPSTTKNTTLTTPPTTLRVTTSEPSTISATTTVLPSTLVTTTLKVDSIVHSSEFETKKEEAFNSMFTTAFVVVGCVAAGCIVALVVIISRKRRAWIPHAVPTTPPASCKELFPPAPTPVNFNTDVVLA